MTNPGRGSTLLGQSEAMERLRVLIRKVAPTDLTVLIEGPTGAGKELVAQELHELSGRPGAFVACNVCALPDTLFEDALFGHVRGAFSGALADSTGLMMEADRGTLFLDEIGSLPATGQAKLLRTIEYGQFRPVGASSDRRSTFRVIAATHEDLHSQVQRGQFRQDLFQRIATIPIHVPALRRRPDDIPLLARHFLAQGVPADRTPRFISDDGLLYLQELPWPGNVRQLKHVMASVAILADRPVIDRADLAAVVEALDGGPQLIDSESMKRARIIAALRRHGWRKADAAAQLGVHRVTLTRWIKRLQITPPRRPATRRSGSRSVTPSSDPVTSHSPLA